MTEGKVMEWGPIPPAAGPHRDLFLETNGVRALEASRTAYATVIDLLGEIAGDIPTMHEPLIESNDVVRYRVQDEKRREWETFHSRLNAELLDAIERHARQAEALAVAALNFLEDHELADEAHRAIHQTGFVRRGLFGCPIVLRDDDFWSTCPVSISHCRVGMSAALIGDFECSICGRLVEDCDHQMGAAYPKVASVDSDGTCTICGARQCEHAPGAEYMLIASSNGRNLVIDEVSRVSRPRYPQARFVAWTIDLEEAANDENVRQAAHDGMLRCDICLGPCAGLNEMTEELSLADLPTTI
ncbi:hypothetical protein [Leifsonia poae]|nr:hypothetical protein [Leifsonia poae]